MKALKWLLGIAGAIVLGALGSGLWDLFLKRFSFWIANATYSIATLGLDTFRDAIYAEAAKGYYEQPSLALLYALPIFFMGMFAFLLAAPRLLRFRDRERPVRPEVRVGPAYEQYLADLESYRNRIRRQAQLIAAGGVLAATMLIAQVSRVQITNSVIAHFHRCLAVSGPVLKAEEEKSLRARFASMRSRAEYRVILKDIEDLARTRGIALPPE